MGSRQARLTFTVGRLHLRTARNLIAYYELQYAHKGFGAVESGGWFVKTIIVHGEYATLVMFKEELVKLCENS